MPAEPRRNFPVPIRVHVRHDDGRAEEEYAVNLSPTGLCLHAPHDFTEAEEFQVRFALPPSGPEVEARCRVMWTSVHAATELAPRFWEAGLQFLDLDPALTHQLHDYASQPVDRRR